MRWRAGSARPALGSTVRDADGVIAVVTGSSGFIGRHLVDRLLAEQWEVHALRRDASRAAGRMGLTVHTVRWDAPDPLRGVDVLDRADAVFHLAGVTKGRTLEHFRDGNVRPTRVLADAIARSDVRTRLVHVSSQAAAGPASRPDAPVRESDEPRPIEAYGRSKLEAEQVIGAARIDAVVLRPTAVYGPGDVDFLRLFRLVRRGIVPLPSEGSSLIDIVYVTDVVDALVAAAAADRAAPGTYFIGGETISWEQLVGEIAMAMSRGRPRLLSIPRWPAYAAAMMGEGLSAVTGRSSLLNRHKVTLGRQRYWICAHDAARERLGYAPHGTLPRGLRETYLWYVENRWLPST